MAASTGRNGTKIRLYLLAAMLVFWCGAICVRLVYLQIFCYGQFEQREADGGSRSQARHHLRPLRP